MITASIGPRSLPTFRLADTWPLTLRFAAPRWSRAGTSKTLAIPTYGTAWQTISLTSVGVTPAVSAKAGSRVVGYALVMPREFAAAVPILRPFFTRLDTLLSSLSSTSAYLSQQIEALANMNSSK